MNPELRHLRSFVMAAEELHFSRAAQRLHLTQQALSTHIAQLETMVGGRLFVRTTREVELSQAGKAMLDPARNALAEAERALTAAKAELERPSVGIGVIGYAPRLIVAELSKSGIDLITHELTFAEQLRRVEQGRLDLALGTVPLPPPALEFEPVRREHLVAAVPIHHQLAALNEIPLAKLAEHPIVLADPGRHEDWNRFVRDAFRRHGLEPQVAREAFGSLATLHALLEHCCTILTSLAPPHPQVAIREITPRIEWVTSMVWNPATDTPAAATARTAIRQL